jgi:hypothetical protein
MTNGTNPDADCCQCSTTEIAYFGWVVRKELTKNRKITSQAIMINGMTTHYQWKVANSEQTISPEIIIRSIRIDNFHTKVIWILQRIEDIIEHSSCPLRIG